jgi:hypothetical protein
METFISELSSKSAENELYSMSTYSFNKLFGSDLSKGITHPKKRKGCCFFYREGRLILLERLDSCISLVLDISTAWFLIDARV